MILILVMLSSFAFAECEIPQIVHDLRPGAEWTMRNNDPDTLVWNSTQTIPTKAEVVAAVSACQADVAARKTLKIQARKDVKNNALTPAQRLQALITLLDFDQ